MEVEKYEEIMSVIRNFKGLSYDLMNELKQVFPSVNDKVLFSILVLEYQQKMKINHIKSYSIINKYFNMYMEGIANGEPPGIILRIAKEVDVAPCLIAKLILKKHFFQLNPNNQQVQINQYLRNTALIEDQDLSYEIYLCTLYDNIYSPIMDSVKQSLGQQYEIQLYRTLTDLGLAFRDECELRKFGYDKTPDVKLEVPVAIDGFIIHWIESKAVFANEDVHKEYVKNQYSSYWNRFGPGLVIYWFGYLKSITEKDNKHFIIRDHMPTNILHIIPPSTIKQTSKESSSTNSTITHTHKTQN